MKTWLIRGIAAVAIATATLAVGGAASAVRRLPDLEPWHRLVSRLEPRAGDVTNTFTVEDYLTREEAVFREVRDRVDAVVSAGANRPLVLVGHSNGGALVTKYALDALDDATLPAPARLILVLPMIGVSPAARLARAISLRTHRRKSALDRRGARVQPGQVQLVPRQPRHADVPARARLAVSSRGPNAMACCNESRRCWCSSRSSTRP